MPSDTDKIVAELLAQFTELEQIRRPLEPAWDEVTRLIYPRRSSWNLNPKQLNPTVGEDIYDGTAINALNLMSDGVQGKLVTSSMPWFKLRFRNRKIEDEKGAKEWIEDTELSLYSIYNQCSFYDAMSEVFPDGIALGTAYLFVEAAEGEGVVFSPRHHKEMYISENRFGKVDTFYRKFSMTHRQALETFGDGLPESISELAKTRPEESVSFLHAVRPRSSKPTGPDVPAKLKRYGSYYLVYKTAANAAAPAGDLVRESGYDYFPLVAWRFKKNPGEVYGRGPGMDAIYDVQMINQASKSLQEASHRALRPPLVAHEMFRGRIRTNPGGVTYWDGQGDPDIRELNQLGAFPLSLEAINRMEKIIREHFHADFFTILSMQRDQASQGSPKTATEIAAITAETASIMGAIVSRNQSELLVPTLTLTYVMARELGLIAPPPRGLIEKYGDAELEPEFIGPLALAQKQYLSYQGTFEAGAAVCQLADLAQMPDLKLNFDWDAIIRAAGESKGIASKNIKSPADVASLKEQVAQARMAQMQMDLQLQAAKVGPDPNKAPEPGSPASGGA